ncbi:carboxylesterase family protein [Nocardia sp. CA-107356]|uniref:carboxylesterase family protein n=1 Tax=Nocardia sp. CA-107356 TaxID=3239972 RepID=UPI003D91AD25
MTVRTEYLMIAPEPVHTETIRYATAGRFERPRPVTADDPASGQLCPQLSSRLDAVMGRPHDRPPQGEDCLNLSIATPARDHRARPVMVWLHGGGFNSGGGLMQWYDGSRLSADGDVVVVSVNYRLSIFGFLHLDGISTGNLGILDQLEALRWVHAHIGEYGGDPDNVTLFGQSAGGVSARLLMEVPEARGLFHRVIMQSAPLSISKQDPEIAARAAEIFADHLGSDPRTADPADILRAVHATAAEWKNVAAYSFEPPFGPTGGVGPLDASDDRLGELATDLDVLYGWNADDLTAFAPQGRDIEPMMEEIFAAPWRALNQRLVRAGAHTQSYRLDWRPDGSAFGATHCLELPLLLGPENAWRGSPMLGGTLWNEVEAFGTALRRAWISFARTGTPDYEATASWPITWRRETDSALRPVRLAP